VTTVIDGRRMEPPEPLERTLQALDELAEGDDLLLLLHCQPHPLYTLLEQRGCEWSDVLRADGTREVRISRQRG